MVDEAPCRGLCCSIALAPAPAARDDPCSPAAAWAAIDRGDACEALSRSVRIARQGQGPGERRFRLHARPPPLGRVPCAAEPHAARRIERDARRSATSRSCWSARGGWAWSRGPAAGAGDHRRGARCGGDAGRSARRRPGAASPTPICSTARRPRSMPRPRAAPFAALAKSGEHHLDSAPRHECRHQPDAHPRRDRSRARSARRDRARRRQGRARRPVEGRRSAPRSRRPGSSRGRRSCAPSRSGTGSTIAGSATFRAMSDIAKPQRGWFAERFVISRPEVVEAQVSSDGTRKWLLQDPRRPRFRDGVHPRRRPRHLVRVEPGRLHAQLPLLPHRDDAAGAQPRAGARSSAR